ncbi:acetoin utilization protein AcuC [Neomicrococcus aestuarii]|uniref:acetoin utilization protein AcuC n=1 Tax=Neomicrococcus aestuarii TaxID=556325 RepID=UPI000AA843C0
MTEVSSAKIVSKVVWSQDYLSYRFSDSHPMNPIRLDLTMRLAEALNVCESRDMALIEPFVASDEELAAVHIPEYIAAVHRGAENPSEEIPEFGLGSEDNPLFPAIHDSAALIAGGSIAAAREIIAGTAQHVVNFAGGLHHAAVAKASGFCIYNDAALAIQELLDHGFERVLYIDVDAHHGDGTEQIFWNDPRVMTISLHESGVSLFPGTGFANETGGPDALGTAVNIAVPSRTSDAGWLRAFHSIVPQITEQFEPQVIVSQHGCDAHAHDDLTNLRLSVDAQRQNMLDIAELAKRFSNDRWIATGGGGYNVIEVVPRAWTHLMAIAGGQPIPLRTEVPASYREYVLETYGVEAPEFMSDGAELWWRSWEVGYDPSDPIDRTIMATRKEIFPLYGLDPWFD